jgi:hypothetical protein
MLLLVGMGSIDGSVAASPVQQVEGLLNALTRQTQNLSRSTSQTLSSALVSPLLKYSNMDE